MRKKYLSALLFGALLVTSAGTFTSCKDYDDDINGLQEQITDLQTAVKSLEDLVNAGKYVTGVEKTTEGIKFTFNQGEPVIITLDEAGQEGQVFELRDGEIYVDNEPTGIKPAKDPEKAPVKVENGVWMFLNAEGEYESTGIPVSGVSVSGNEEDGFVLVITDANGNSQKVEVPTANSLVSSITFATPVTLGADLYSADFIVANKSNDIYMVDGTKISKGTVVSAINKDGSKGVSVNVVVTPSNVDPADLKFSLVNSDGETIFANGVVSQPSTLTRAMDGVYTLHFALKDGLTIADLKDNKIIGNEDLLAVNCGKATTDFVYVYDDELGDNSTANASITTNSLFAKLGEEYSIFGEGYTTDPTTTSAASLIKEAFINSIKNVSSVKLTVDENYADVYGITIDETGTKFKITKNPNNITSIDFNLVYTGAQSTDASKLNQTAVKLTVKLAKDALVSSNVIEATHTLTTDNTSTTDVDEEVALLPLTDFIASLSSAEKIVWNAEGTTAKIYSIANNVVNTSEGIKLTSSKEYGTTPAALNITSTLALYKSDKKTTTTKPSEAAYIGIAVNPETADVTADTYAGEHQITFGTVKKNVTIKLTLTNPATQYTRIPLYFDGDNLTAYGSVNGNYLEFNVETAYNNGEDAPSFTVENKESKDKWGVKSDNSTIQIPLSKLYTTTQKFEVSYLMFTGATNNKVTETIYVKGQSPIKDGEITVSKTELSLATGSDTFTAADIKGVDVFNKTYQILASYTQEVMEGTTVKTKATVGTIDPRIEEVKFVVTDANAGAFEIKATYAEVDADGKLILTTKDATSDLKVNATEGRLVSFSIKLNENAAIANGAKVPFKLTVTDKWNQKFEKEISLTVEK